MIARTKRQIIHNKSSKKVYQERRAAGVCTRCCEHVVNGKSLCIDCAIEQKTHIETMRRRRLETGLCLKCGKDAAGQKSCVACAGKGNARKKEYYRRKRVELLEAYGGACKCCGETTPEFLQVDHVNNDGAEHRKTIPGSTLMSWLRRNNYPQDDFQLLCANCNFAKGHYGQCPHQRSSNEKSTIALGVTCN